MDRLGARDLPSVMLAERRLILMGVVAMGARFVRVKTASLAVSQGRHREKCCCLRHREERSDEAIFLSIIKSRMTPFNPSSHYLRVLLDNTTEHWVGVGLGAGVSGGLLTNRGLYILAK